MFKTYKILRIIMILISIVFSTISILAFLFSIKEAFSNYYLDWSYIGVYNFIAIFLKFKEIFAATIVLLTLWYTIEQFLNNQKLARRVPWFDIFMSKLKEWKRENPIIYEVCLLNIEDLFECSEKLKGKLKNENQLRILLNKFVKPWIDKFEMKSENYLLMDGLYPNKDYAYSAETFFEILIYIVQPTQKFKKLFVDKYKEIYSEILINSEFGKAREIDHEKFTQKQQRLDDLATVQ